MILSARLRTHLFSLSLALAGLVACDDSTSATKPEATKRPADATGQTASDAPALPDAAALLAASAEAHGGAARLDALHSYYTESQLTMSAMGLSGVVKTWWKDDDFYSETEIPGVGLSRLGGQGGKVWGDDPINNLREITGIEAEQARWGSSPCVVHRWQRYFKSATTTAVVKVDGRELAEILLVSHLGDKVTLRIDTATKMPVSQSFAQANPFGAVPVTATYGDFREIDGYQIPFRQEADAALGKISATTLRYDVNVDIDASRFVPPGPTAIAPTDLVYDDAPTNEAATADKATKVPTKPRPEARRDP